jgi:hypothetical protein
VREVGSFGMSARKTDQDGEEEPTLPPVGLNVWVQCEGFRCLAYRTKDGKWLTAIGNKEVKAVIRVLSLD